VLRSEDEGAFRQVAEAADLRPRADSQRLDLDQNFGTSQARWRGDRK
jgi:hypothetical protein